MGVREALNRRPNVAAVTAALALVVASVFGVTWLRADHGPTPRLPSKSFFTVDDGATLFADGNKRIVPFDHDGNQAVAAFVFTADDGAHQWVQYLQKYSPQAQALLRTQLTSHDSAGMDSRTIRDGLLVKRPGTGHWVKMTDPAAMSIMKPAAPAGMGTSLPRLVFP